MSKRIKLNDLKPDPRNHNKHTASGMPLLEKSVEQVGVIESITVSNDDQIISGNARHEVIGRKFDSEPIVIETDGTRPVILKRTDIQSNTPEFYKASILANTTAKKNIDIDIEVVEELAEEYNFDFDDVGIDIEERLEKVKDGDTIHFEQSVQLQPPKEYILIMAEPNSSEWEELKSELKLKMVRRGGYKEGSVFDAVGLERVLMWEDFKKRINVNSDTKQK